MVGIIKNLFGGKDNYYAELDESKQGETQPSQPQPEPKPAKMSKEEKKEVKSAPKPAPVAQKQPSTAVPQPSTAAAVSQEGETFAPNYLMPKVTSFRRRPGANMESFKELAREMNLPRNQ